MIKLLFVASNFYNRYKTSTIIKSPKNAEEGGTPPPRLKGGKFRNGAPCGEDHGVGGARAVAYGWQHGEQAKRGGGRFG